MEPKHDPLALSRIYLGSALPSLPMTHCKPLNRNDLVEKTPNKKPSQSRWRFYPSKRATSRWPTCLDGLDMAPGKKPSCGLGIGFGWTAERFLWVSLRNPATRRLQRRKIKSNIKRLPAGERLETPKSLLIYFFCFEETSKSHTALEDLEVAWRIGSRLQQLRIWSKPV